MPEEKTEMEKFLSDLPTDQHVEPLEPEADAPAEVPEKEAEEDADSRKNRRHRRLEEALQRERESNIALSERIKTLSEMERFTKDFQPDTDIHQVLFGTTAQTDETKATALGMQRVLEKFGNDAYTKAINDFDKRRADEAQQQREEERFIDSELEAIEDEANVDLTSNSPAARKARTEFLSLVEKLSPKDQDGNIKDYADFSTTFEIYQNSRKPDASRAKSLAARTMQSTGASQPSKLEENAHESYLRDQGII